MTGQKLYGLKAPTEDTEAATKGYVDENILQIKASIADAWTSGKTYAVGDYCISGNQLYKCKTVHTAGSTFNADYWDAVSVSKEILETASKYPKVFRVDNIETSTTEITFSERPQYVMCVAHTYSSFSSSVPNAAVYIIVISKTNDDDIGSVLLSNSTPSDGIAISNINVSSKTITLTWKKPLSRLCWFIPYA